MRLGKDRSRGATTRRRLGTTFGVHDMAIDLGTANTLVYVGGEGIVVSEPSVVAIDEFKGEVHAVGSEAERMLGRTPATISAVRPLRHGVIADFEVTEQMLRYFIRRVLDSRRAHPRVIVCAPSGVTAVEQRAVEEATLAAGARRVQLIEEPIAAAIGAGIAIEEPIGRMIVNVGGGTSEVAVISLGGIVLSRSIRVGGYEMDDALSQYMKNVHQLAIGSRTAESIKLAIGSALPLAEEQILPVRGRHLVSGLPTEVKLHSEEVREALRAPLQEILLRDHRDARGDAAGAGRRHLPRGHPARRRLHPDARSRGHGRGRDPDADARRRVAPDLRRRSGRARALEHYDALSGSATGRRGRASGPSHGT